MAECVFCAIARGEIKADVVEINNQIMVVRDINPCAPDHLLVVPIEHIPSLTGIVGNQTLGGALLEKCAEIGLFFGKDLGYRVVINNGTNGGQTIGHLHFHVLAGRSLGWPPG